MSRIFIFALLLSCAYLIRAETEAAAAAAPAAPAVDTAALTSHMEKLQAASIKQVSQEAQKLGAQLAGSVKEEVASQLRSTVQTLQQHYTELASKSSSLASQSDSLAGKLDGLGANVAKVVESLQKDIASVRTQLEGFGKTQSELAGKVAKLLERESDSTSFATTVTEKLAEVARGAKALETKLEQQAASTKQQLEHLVKVSSVNSFHQATEWVRTTATDSLSCTQKWFNNTVLPLANRVWASLLDIRSVDFVGIWKQYSSVAQQYFIQQSEQLAIRIKQLGSLDENMSRMIARGLLGLSTAIAAFLALKITFFVVGLIFSLVFYVLCCRACRSPREEKRRGGSQQPQAARGEEGTPHKKNKPSNGGKQ